MPKSFANDPRQEIDWLEGLITDSNKMLIDLRNVRTNLLKTRAEVERLPPIKDAPPYDPIVSGQKNAVLAVNEAMTRVENLLQLWDGRKRNLERMLDRAKATFPGRR